MGLIIDIFNSILYQPLFNVLVLLYEYLPGHDFGIAVIVLTIIIRIILYPLMAQSIKSQKTLAELQPKIQEIQRKHKDNKAEQSRVMMELYQKEKFNPFGGCLPLLAQFPILIGLYQVFWRGLQPEQLNYLYSFVSHPGVIDPTFLGIINLSQPSIVLAIFAGVSQFFQSKMIIPAMSQSQQKNNQMPRFSGMMQMQMVYFFPLFTVFILWKLPSAIGLYWLVTTIFSIIQQYLIYKPRTKSMLGTGQKT